MTQKYGLKWLDGKSWSEVTRDERFFCAHLYKKVLEHLEGIPRFIRTINEACGLSLDETANWELGYEVCFYRDLWFYKPEKYEVLSPKRTFDLCLFSDEAIIIIEAKAYQRFDKKQVEVFNKDKERIAELGILTKVLIVALASSGYENEFADSDLVDYFDGRLLTWHKLSEKYDNDIILQSADRVYSFRPQRPGGKIGEKLLDFYPSIDDIWVGRDGGLKGLQGDIKDERWKNRRYEIILGAFPLGKSRKNWFSLEDFVNTVGNIKN